MYVNVSVYKLYQKILFYQFSQFLIKMEIEDEDNDQFLDKLKRGQFRDKTFNEVTDNHIKIISFLQKLQIPQTQNDGEDMLKLLQNLFKYYGFPIFICLQRFYAKITQKSDFVTKNMQNLKNLASIVKNKLQDRKLDQLSFYFKILDGTYRKKYKIIPSQQQVQFINYIERISKIYSQTNDLVQNSLKGKRQANFIEIVNDKINKILESDLSIRKMNMLQSNYQNYIKSKAISIIQQISNLVVEDQESQKSLLRSRKEQKITEQQKNKLKIDPNTPLCCRTFFLKGQPIHQPQSLHLQYKNYHSFPWPYEQQNILKKTICGFLNAQGGTIFIGIAQSIDNKRRVVQGGYYDQGVKQDVNKYFTRMAKSIQPDIITNILYGIQFVPVRNSKAPYNFISGKYIIKVSVRYGVRDDIYSYRKENQETDYFAFRTENQVVHRSGRIVLNALKERIRNPLPKPDLIHPGPCPKPDVGKPVYRGDHFDRSFQDSMILSNVNIRQINSHPSKPNLPPDRINSFPTLNSSPKHTPQPNNDKNQKKIYRPSKFYFLITGASHDKLIGFWKANNVSPNDLKAKNISNKQTMVQLDTQIKYQNFLLLQEKLKKQVGVEIIQPTDKLMIAKDLDDQMRQTVWNSLYQKQIQVLPGKSPQQMIFENIPAAVLANSLINGDFGIQTKFY